jgi:glutathione S-transferase
MIMALTLFHNDMSVCAQKVRLCLAEKQLAYEDKHLNLRVGDQKRPEYLALNPNGYVPTLVHDDFVLGESTVICEYIDDAFTAPPLRPSDPRARARMRSFTKFIDAAIFPATGTVSMSIAFHHQFRPDVYDTMEKARPGWLVNFRQLQKSTENPAFPAAIRRLDKMIADMEQALADHRGPWLAGETYSLADVGYAPYVTRLDHLKFLDEMVEKRPRVAGWYDRMRARPSYTEALVKWFNRKYLPLMDEKGSEAWPRVRDLLAA